MQLDKLNGKYQVLRTELDAAYSAPSGTAAASTASPLK